MRIFFQMACFLLVGATAVSGQAQELNPSCLTSFNVKEKGYTSGGATMSCRLVEQRRVALSQAVLNTPQTGEIDGDMVAQHLAKMDADLKRVQDEKNWVGMANVVTGSTLATVGLSACLSSAGAGCMLAAVGKIMATHSIYDMGASEAAKSAQIVAMRGQIAQLKAAAAGKRSAAKAMRDRMVADASAMCFEVKANCL